MYVLCPLTVVFFEMQAKWPTVEKIWGFTQAKAEAADQQGWLMDTVVPSFSPSPRLVYVPMHHEYSEGTGRENFGKIPHANSKKVSIRSNAAPNKAGLSC